MARPTAGLIAEICDEGPRATMNHETMFGLGELERETDEDRVCN